MYCTQADLEQRFGRDYVLSLADRDRDGEADAGVIDQALDDAAAEINAYVAGRYALPLPSVPPLLVRIACDVAIYRLAPGPGDVTDELRRRFEDAVSLLRRISSGEVSLGLPNPEPAPSQAVPGLVSGGRADFKGRAL